MSNARLTEMVNDGASAIFLLNQYARQAVHASARSLADELQASVDRWLTDNGGCESPRTHTSPRAPTLLNRSPLRKVALVGEHLLEERRHYVLSHLSRLRMLTTDTEQLQWLDAIEKYLLTGMLSPSPSPELSDTRRVHAARTHSARMSPHNFDLRYIDETASAERNRPRSHSFIL